MMKSIRFFHRQTLQIQHFNTFKYTVANQLFTTTTTTSKGLSPKTPLQSYQDLILRGDISEDENQLKAIQKLQGLYEDILLFDAERAKDTVIVGSLDNSNESSWFTSIFNASPLKNLVNSSSNANKIKGLYMYGGTGCGKTFLMDLFFEVLPIKKKMRVHFSNFMIDIHKRLHRLKNEVKGSGEAQSGNIMSRITNELMDEAYVICFDEFQVTDIADALILKSLFESLLDKGVIVIATSNRAPTDLYKNGLQRVLFVPFIKVLSEATDVHSLLESSMDYRIVKSANQSLNKYLSPRTEENQKFFDIQFRRLSVPVTADIQALKLEEYSVLSKSTSTKVRYSPMPISLSVFGHEVHVSQAVVGRKIARFSFPELCDEALGAADYIHLSETFRVIFLSDVPHLNLDTRNEMRRFITLVDALYESSVRLIVLADDIPTKLLQLTEKEKKSPADEVFAFDRAISRLLEMQSEPYLLEALAKYPVEVGGSEWLLWELTKKNTAATGRNISIWKQYNWDRDTLVPLPSSCLQVLLIDLIDMKKTNSEINASLSNNFIMNVDSSIERIKKELAAMNIAKERNIKFSQFNKLLVFNE